jgi:hypothetical protein
MARYKATQPAGFFDAHLRLEQLREMEDPILRLHEAVNWEMFRATLTELTRVDAKGPGGTKAV